MYNTCERCTCLVLCGSLVMSGDCIELLLHVVQDQWYPDLKSTVKKIDQTFQRNFRDIGCAGEVSLAEHADYDKFAVQIK